MSIADTPPDEFRVRAATLEDAPAIAELINVVHTAEIGRPWTSVEEVRDDLASPSVGAWIESVVLLEEDGSIVGFLQVSSNAPPFDEIEHLAYVRPELWGRGLNAWLLRLGEERARANLHRAPADERVLLYVPRWATNEPAARLFRALGYAYARTFWIMEIELDEHPASPVVPEGIRIETFDRERDERGVYAALSEAFEDHWGHVFPTYEQWLHYELNGESAAFDPGLWFIALDGDEVVGASCGRASTPGAPDSGEVTTLGVRRAWRGRGVGRAMLLLTFGELRRRGITRAQLGVDSESRTGATRLYEGAGMHVAQISDFWVKELRRQAEIRP